jgi:tetratricopeptide (TPR) repeat protein
LECPNIGTTLNSIGNYYKAIGDNVQALQYYDKVLQCKIDQHNSAITLLNIGSIHMNNKDYGQAMKLCNEAHDVLHQINPCPHAAIIHCYGVIGDIHLGLQDYSLAGSLYFTAFEMCKKISIY